MFGILRLAAAQVMEKPAAVPLALVSENATRLPSLNTVLDGFNGSVTFAVAHDSYIGWYDVVTPVLSYAFTPRYSADVSFSVYPYRLAPNQSATVTAATRLLTTKGDLSDVLLAFHATFRPGVLQDAVTFSMTAPTGNRPHGLGMGQSTFDLSNYMQRYTRRGGWLVETGVGDSAGLFNRLVPAEDVSAAPVAHFQAGLFAWMVGRSYLESVAYEQLPIGDQKLYTTVVVRPGFPPQAVVTGRRVAEDNGLTTSVGVPLSSHVTWTTAYNRSLRLHLDTFSTGVTYVFRSRRRSDEALIDAALREAERTQ